MPPKARRGASSGTRTASQAPAPVSSSSSSSSLAAKRSRAVRSDTSESSSGQDGSDKGGGTPSPPVRRRTASSRAVAAPRQQTLARTSVARKEAAARAEGERASSRASTSNTAQGRSSRARRIIQSDGEEEDGDDNDNDTEDTGELSQEKVTDNANEQDGDAREHGEIATRDPKGASSTLLRDDDDEQDATIVEQTLLGDSEEEVPAAPLAKRARVVSNAQTATPTRKSAEQVKHDYKSPTPSPHSASHSPVQSITMQPPSSSSPRTPEGRSNGIRRDERPSVQTLATPAAVYPHTPAREDASSAITVAATPGPSKLPVEPPKTRLVIHKMILRNFKSYAGEQTIGPFHKSFTAVVGPNGSGKSNVIDAMLFVFGWRANKMRQGKLGELIHNSAGQENIGSCTVEVWFRDIVDLPGADDYKVVPNSRLIVARTAYRNNTSVYTLNNKKSSFTEVTTLLRGRGIDLDHKRFLILQGEVESIAQMPPKAKNEHEEGLLEYLEDIIGTSSYKTPIEEANKKVDELNDVRGERLSRLKIVQKEKDSLEGKKREAETFLRDQNELTTRQSALWQINVLQCKDEIHIATTAMEKLRKQIDEETEKNSGSRAEMDSLEAQFKEISSEYDKSAKEADKVTKEIIRLEKEDVQLQEKRKHLETKKKKLAKTLADDKKGIAEATATKERSTEEIESFGAEVKQLEVALGREEAELETLRESLKGKTEVFSKAIAEKQQELQPWTARRSEKLNAKNIALEEKRLLEDRFRQAEEETDQAKAALLDLETASEAKQDERERLKGEKEQQAKKARQYDSELKDMQTQEASLRSKATSSRSKCEEAKASMQSNQSRGEVLNSLARQADLGMIKGFHGRLGNLGTIDERFDVAISTACPGLDNIVVEGVETGQACIEHLRRNNLGRANFILLNSLAKTNTGRINTPENVHRLFDLVQPREPRFAAAFYHQLRDTLVASDLAQANRIAYGAQRYRVVTLDGQLIDKSGTMSGGGTRVARGAMSSKPVTSDVTLEQLSRLDKERQLDQDGLASHLKYMTEMRGLLEAAKSRIPQIDMEIEKIDLDLGNSVRMIEEAKRRVKNIASQHGPDVGDVNRIKELTKLIEAHDKELSELSEKSSTIENEIASLQEKILEAGGLELRTQKSKVDGIRERVDLVGERATKAEVAKSKSEKDIAKLSRASQKNEEALASLDAEFSSVEEDISSNSETLRGVRKQVDDKQYEMESKQEIKDEIKAKLDACLEGINAFRSLEVEIRQKLEDNEKSLSDNEKRLHHWHENLSKLSLHRIDGDEDTEPEKEKALKSRNEQGQNDDHPSANEPNADDQRDTSAELSAALELQEYSPDELRGMSKDTLKSEISTFEEKLANGQANLSVLEEYRRRENEFLARAQDLDETTQERDRAKELFDNLRKERLESFMAGFSIISAKLKEMYQTITLGGNAELELVDSLDPFSEGILFSVMPPRKSWKNISNLSGGEKTLSSLALVFALHAFKPTPLYAMDELDAALDFRNVSIVANLIKERTKGAQFIVISLRNNMFELASRLVGIYKTNGQTKSLAVHNSDLHAQPTQPQPPKSIMPSSTRGSQPPWATPRVPGSVRPGGATPMQLGVTSQAKAPPSTIRRSHPPMGMAVASSHSLSASAPMAPIGPPALLTTPGPARFGLIPQTPRTGNIKGLGMASMGSSIKLTSSHSVRGGLGNSLYERNTSRDTQHQQQQQHGLPPTPLATRRPN